MESKELEVRIERLSAMPAAYACSFSSNPEEEAIQNLKSWVENRGIIVESGMRLFGRNTYPTDKPNPRGYEVYLTLEGKKEDYNDIETAEIPEGLYAVLRFRSLENIEFAWKKLWNWIERNGYEHIGWKRGRHGWVDGFEEQINWHQQKPPTEWVFDLWVQLKEG